MVRCGLNRSVRLAAPLLLAGLLACLGVMGSGGVASAAALVLPPHVISRTPADGQTDIPVNQAITITFDQDLDPATVTAGNFSVLKATGFPLPATVTYDLGTKTATLTPTARLTAGSTYYVTLSTGVHLATKQSVSQSDIVWHFDTVPPIPPHIVSQAPADGAVNQSIAPAISVVFDSDMDPATFTSSTFHFAKQGGAPLPAAINYNVATRTATLTPQAQLLENTKYQISMTAEVRALDGMFVLGAPFVWTFTTIPAVPPQIVARTPADGDVDVPLDVRVFVTFDWDLSKDTLTSASFTIKKSGGMPLPADVTCNGKTATLKAVADLDPESTYIVTMDGTIKGSSGASILGAPVSWSFKTKAAPWLFSDVPPTSAYHAAIVQLATRKIIGGFTDGTFHPIAPVTRQQFAKTVVLTLGYAVSEQNVSPFTDVPKTTAGHLVDPNDPLYPDHYVAVAASHHITQGKTATLFLPYGNITRFQAITMVVRGLDDLHPGLLKTPPSSYHSTWSTGLSPDHGQNARRAEYNLLLAGLPLDDLDPLGPITRGEVAQLEWNALILLQQ